jgi:hypothetical protein
VEERRRELFTVLKNIARLAFSEALAFTSSLLQAALARSDAPFQVRLVSGGGGGSLGSRHGVP